MIGLKIVSLQKLYAHFTQYTVFAVRLQTLSKNLTLSSKINFTSQAQLYALYEDGYL